MLVKVAEPAGRRTQATHDSRKLRFVWDLGTCQCARKPHTCLPEMATWLAKTGGNEGRDLHQHRHRLCAAHRAMASMTSVLLSITITAAVPSPLCKVT